MKTVIFGRIFDGERFRRRMLIDGEKIVVDDSESAPEEARVLDFGGKIVAPPMCDCHVHFFQTGIYLRSVDVRGVRSVDALLDFLRTVDPDSHITGEIVWVWGYDPADRMPTSAELDDALGGVPVVLRRVDGHSCSVSTAAMKMLPENLKSPEGVYYGAQQEQVIEHFLRLTPVDALKLAAHTAADSARKAGALRVHALVPYLDWALLLEEIADQLAVEVRIFTETTDVDAVAEAGFEHIGGCLLLDGSFGSHTAALLEPYSDNPDTRGVLYWSDRELEKFFRRAMERSLSVAMHAIGDAAVEQYIRCAEKVSGGAPLRGWRIEHAELIHPGQIERAARLGLTLSVQPAFEAYWGGPNRLYAQRLGERWKLTNPFSAEFEAELNPIGGSDSYVTPINPVFGVRSAVNHPNRKHALTPERALSMFTYNLLKWERYFANPLKDANPWLWRGRVTLSVIPPDFSDVPEIVFV